MTTNAEDGYPVYLLRDNGRAVNVGRAHLDNRWAVLYNPYQLLKFDVNIDVEICSTVASDFGSRLILTRYYNNTMDIALPSEFNSIVVTVSVPGLIFLSIHRINVFKC